MRTIRASEIGLYLYCRRAWWYHNQGVRSENQAELASGSELHRLHGRRVLMAGMLRWLACGLLLAAVLLLTVYLTGRLL